MSGRSSLFLPFLLRSCYPRLHLSTRWNTLHSPGLLDAHRASLGSQLGPYTPNRIGTPRPSTQTRGEHTVRQVLSVVSRSSSLINPAAKYPAKQSPAPVVSTTPFTTVAAGRYPTVWDPAGRYRIPLAPRVHISPKSALDRRNKSISARAADAIGASGVVVGADAGALPVVDGTARPVSFKRSVNSPSLTINQLRQAHGNCRSSSPESIGEGLKMDVTPPEWAARR